MGVRKIVTYPNLILRKPLPREEFDFAKDRDCLRRDLQDLHDSLDKFERGAAIAANQVALSRRVFIVARPQGAMPTVAFNPMYSQVGEQREVGGEGCLSFPGYYRDVERWSKIKATFDELGSDDVVVTKTVELEGWWARVFQHETDHLDGTLFVDDLPKVVRDSIAQRVINYRLGR